MKGYGVEQLLDERVDRPLSDCMAPGLNADVAGSIHHERLDLLMNTTRICVVDLATDLKRSLDA